MQREFGFRVPAQRIGVLIIIHFFVSFSSWHQLSCYNSHRSCLALQNVNGDRPSLQFQIPTQRACEQCEDYSGAAENALERLHVAPTLGTACSLSWYITDDMYQNKTNYHHDSDTFCTESYMKAQHNSDASGLET